MAGKEGDPPLMSPRSSPWGRWAPILRRIAEMQSAILLTVLYALLWVPIGALSFLFEDWLHRRPHSGTAWLKRTPRLNRPDHLKEPF